MFCKKYFIFLDNYIINMLILILLIKLCGCGGTGRRAGLRNQCQRRGGSSPFIRTKRLNRRTRRKNEEINCKRLIFLSSTIEKLGKV